MEEVRASEEAASAEGKAASEEGEEVSVVGGAVAVSSNELIPGVLPLSGITGLSADQWTQRRAGPRSLANRIPGKWR